MLGGRAGAAPAAAESRLLLRGVTWVLRRGRGSHVGDEEGEGSQVGAEEGEGSHVGGEEGEGESRGC